MRKAMNAKFWTEPDGSARPKELKSERQKPDPLPDLSQYIATFSMSEEDFFERLSMREEREIPFAGIPQGVGLPVVVRIEGKKVQVIKYEIFNIGPGIWTMPFEGGGGGSLFSLGKGLQPYRYDYSGKTYEYEERTNIIRIYEGIKPKRPDKQEFNPKFYGMSVSISESAPLPPNLDNSAALVGLRKLMGAADPGFDFQTRVPDTDVLDVYRFRAGLAGPEPPAGDSFLDGLQQQYLRLMNERNMIRAYMPNGAPDAALMLRNVERRINEVKEEIDARERQVEKASLATKEFDAKQNEIREAALRELRDSARLDARDFANKWPGISRAKREREVEKTVIRKVIDEKINEAFERLKPGAMVPLSGGSEIRSPFIYSNQTVDTVAAPTGASPSPGALRVSEAVFWTEASDRLLTDPDPILYVCAGCKGLTVKYSGDVKLKLCAVCLSRIAISGLRPIPRDPKVIVVQLDGSRKEMRLNRASVVAGVPSVLSSGRKIRCR